MPRALNDKEKNDTIEAFKRAKGNAAFAAALVGIPAGTMRMRLGNLRRDPKWAARVPIGSDDPLPVDPDRMTVAANDAKLANKKIEALKKQVEAARRAGKRFAGKIKPQKKRAKIGLEDQIEVVFPDVHGSYQDPDAVAAFMGDLGNIKPHRVIGVGDLIDCGAFLAQHHVLGHVAETAYTIEDDLAAGNRFLDGLQENAKGAQIELLEGNHEHRFETWATTQALRRSQDARWLFSRVDPVVDLRIKERGIGFFRLSENYDGLAIQGAIRRGKCVFWHGPKRGSADPIRLLSRFGTSTVYGHTHRALYGSLRQVDGTTISAWSIGCLSRLNPLWNHGDPNDWVHRYMIRVIAKSGEFLPIVVPIINGRSLLSGLKF